MPSHPLTVAVITAFVLKASHLIWDRIGSANFIMIIWQSFFVEMWPIWIGLAIGAIYWYVRFLLGISRMAERGLSLIVALANRVNSDKEP